MLRAQSARRGVAAVELALVFMLFMVPLMIGIWEIGRLVQVQQLVSSSAREGARLAAQGYTIANNGTPTQIYATSAGGTPNVKDAVYNYLIAAGLTSLLPSDVTVTFQFTPSGTFPTGFTDPYQGVKNQPFSVMVSIPWAKVRWVNLGFLNPSSQLTFTVNWLMLVDDAFSVNTTLPSW